MSRMDDRPYRSREMSPRYRESRRYSRSRSPYARDRRSPPTYRRAAPTKAVRDDPSPSKVLGVFGLNLETKERDLFDLFSRFGDVDDVTLIYDNYTGRSRGFGFVYMHDIADSRSAKEQLHEVVLDGRPIRVDYSTTQKPHAPTPGVYMGKVNSRFRDRPPRNGYGSSSYRDDYRSSFRGRPPPRSSRGGYGGYRSGSRRSLTPPPMRRRSRSPSFDRYERRY